MGSGHGHGHGHGLEHSRGRAEDRARLRLVLGLTATVALVEVIGAWLSGSLALLGDAGHMITDAAGIVVALSASMVAGLPPTDRRTFGYHRAEIMAALLNALVLLGVCGYLAYAGISRLIDPVGIDAPQMLVFAVIGLAANAVSLGLLSTRRDSSLNMKGAWLEVLGDTLGSVFAIVAGVVVLTSGFDRADSIASLLIAVLILPRSWGLLREATGVLLEAAPSGVDVTDMRTHLERMDGVVGVHDLHAWTITSGMPSLSAHITVSDACLAERGVGAVLDELSRCAREDFGIEHTTFQVEPVTHQRHEYLGETPHP